MSSYSGAAILAIFDRLRHDILGQQSKDLNGKPLTPVVYSHLPLDKMIDPKDYANPWSPSGGSTLQKTFQKPNETPAEAALRISERAKKAICAAELTSGLVDNLLMVTTDGLYQAYSPGRSIAILEQSQSETIKSSQISVSFDYCWVSIDRLWFYNPYLQMQNWHIPSLQSGELAKAFPSMAIAVLLVRNLRIQSNWQSQELQSVQSSAALGPFSLVGRSIEQGTGAIVQPGMQVMA